MQSDPPPPEPVRQQDGAAQPPLRVDLGIFAHNEAEAIGAMIDGLAQQSVWDRPDRDLRAVVLVNGSTDATAAIAREAVASLPQRLRIEVVELAQGGKSRTWNRYVHDLSRPDAGMLLFADADIRLPEADTLERLVDALAGRPELVAYSSRPIKDLVFQPALQQGFTSRLIARSAGTLDSWRTALSGSLYALRTDTARGLHLPVGLPVEDGFLRAMLVTDALEEPEDAARISAEEGLFHIYTSERSAAALVRHQVRIVIGSALNEAIFRHLSDCPPGGRKAELARAAGDDGWLGRVAAERLPRAPWGYVPVHFLVKRLQTLSRDPARRRSPRAIALATLGFGFDLTVYVAAQLRMARGQGPGFW